MCYLVAKEFNDTGDLEVQMLYGQYLTEFKEYLMKMMVYDTIQLVIIGHSFKATFAVLNEFLQGSICKEGKVFGVF